MAVGARYITSVSASSTSVSPGSTVYCTAYPIVPSGEGDYEWIVSPTTGVSQSVYRHYNDITFSSSASGTYTIGCRSTSSCTTPGSYTTIYVNVGSKGGSSTSLSTVYVDPSNNVTVSFDPSISDTKQMFTWRLLNMMTGVLVDSGQISSAGGTLNFSGFPAGLYALQIDIGTGIVETHKIMLN